jgi:hypothetical protein
MALVENLRLDQPLETTELDRIFSGLTDALLEGIIVAKRQRTDIVLSVHVPVSELDSFRGRVLRKTVQTTSVLWYPGLALPTHVVWEHIPHGGSPPAPSGWEGGCGDLKESSTKRAHNALT